MALSTPLHPYSTAQCRSPRRVCSGVGAKHPCLPGAAQPGLQLVSRPAGVAGHPQHPAGGRAWCAPRVLLLPVQSEQAVKVRLGLLPWQDPAARQMRGCGTELRQGAPSTVSLPPWGFQPGTCLSAGKHQLPWSGQDRAAAGQTSPRVGRAHMCVSCSATGSR